MPFTSKTQQTVNALKGEFSGLDTHTRATLLADLYKVHEQKVEDEISAIRQDSLGNLPFNRNGNANTNVVKPRSTAQNRGNPKPKIKRAKRTITQSPSAGTPPTGKRRTRFGQRTNGTLFDAMLQVVARQEKVRGFAKRSDILEGTKHFESAAKSDKERYDLVGSYIQILKKMRGLLTTMKDNKGNDVKGQYVLTPLGKERIKELQTAKVNTLATA